MRRATSRKYIIGQSGGFPLRLSWLPRLIGHYTAQKRVVPANLEVIACDLGVGKNMAKAMRAWGRAAGCLQENGAITETAKRLFIDHDPYLERGESVALLHWLISSNMQRFSVGAWFFNFAHSGDFTPSDAVSMFHDHLFAENAYYSEGTLRRDVEPLLRMYALSRERFSCGSDDRLFSQLNLLSTKRIGVRTVFQRSWMDEPVHVSDKLLAFTVLRTLAQRSTASSPLSELYAGGSGRAAPGTVLGFSREGFFAAIDLIDRKNDAPITLATMPGSDVLLTAVGSWSRVCAAGNVGAVDDWFWGNT